MPIRLTQVLRYSSVSCKFGIGRLWRYYSTSLATNFEKVATNPLSKYHIYLSNSPDPFLNLSIEHYLLQKTPANSTILFIYINRPSVVIGRNQNPWLETNITLLGDAPVIGLQNHQTNMDNIQLVRRRSGGGTVFHDDGNVNFSVICPTADFTRDKHAEMVTRAIRKLNPRARVNERHDIVLDQGSLQGDENQPDPKDMHRTAYHPGSTHPPPLKVSGSAYKLIRQRSLHHGTCLVTSSNLEKISTILHSPARPFMKARGVESVRSPVGNIHQVDAQNIFDFVTMFEFLIVDAFTTMYGISQAALVSLRAMNRNSSIHQGNNYVCGFVGDELLEVAEIMSGMEELKVRLLL